MCFCASEVSARGNAGVSAAMESGPYTIITIQLHNNTSGMENAS